MSLNFHPWLTAACLALALTACGGDRAQQVRADASAATTPTASAVPVISRQPLATAVSAGGSATFTVTAQGAELSYQWQRNGEALPDATRASYTTPAASTTDSGARYSVIVANGVGKVTSQVATLTVTDSGLAN